MCVCVCEALSWKLEPRPLPSTPHKHLYLWSDHAPRVCGGNILLSIILSLPNILSLTWPNR